MRHSRRVLLYATWLTLFVCTCLFVPLHGQEMRKKLDYKNSKRDGSSVEEFLKEASTLKEEHPQQALDKVEEALALSIIRNDPYGQAQSYVLLGEINEAIEEWKLALENYTRALDKLSRLKNTVEYQKSLLGLGNCHLNLNQYKEALAYYEQYNELSLNSLEKIEAFLHISEVFFQMNEYAKSLEAVEKAERVNTVPDDVAKVRIQNQKAKIFAKTNELDKATNLYQSSQNTLRSRRAPSSLPEEKSLETTKENIINAMREQKRYDEEIELRNQSIEYNLELNDLKEATKDKVELGRALAARGETSTALKELEEAAQIADTIGSAKEQAKAFLALADLYEKRDRSDKALEAYRKYSLAVQKSETQRENLLAEKSELIMKQKDIEELTKYLAIAQKEEEVQQAILLRQELTIYGLTSILLILATTSYLVHKNAKASKTANQLLALKSLRSQMNPHFIFNALNSVNHFVAQNDERTANRFLSEFSMLMRLVLENSQEDFISLLKEHEIITLYLKLEHYRFRDKFEYELRVADDINMESIEIPPMLIQPYIENAVWHGLRYKETKGRLCLLISKNEHELLVEVIDDGIGRKKSMELKTKNQKKHNSTGLRNIQERLDIINKVYHTSYHVTVSDLDDTTGTGTKVAIHLPFQITKIRH